MPPNVTVFGKFTGIFKVIDGAPDNVIWNAWVTVDFGPQGTNNQTNYDCMGCRGPGTDGANWKTERIGYDPRLSALTSVDGTSNWTLSLSHCQTGPSGNFGIANVACSTTGATVIIETIPVLPEAERTYYQQQLKLK